MKKIKEALITKDNPVPSLDLQWLKNKSIEYFKKNNIPWKDTIVTTDFIFELIRKNGVETDKEQPVNYCEFSGTKICSIDDRSSDKCTECNKQFTR